MSSGTKLVTPELYARFSELLKKANAPGSALAIVRLESGHGDDNELVVWGTMTEDCQPTTADTLYNLASVSKAFTSTAMSILIDDFARGRNRISLPHGLKEFTWETKLKDLLPGDWDLIDPWATERANVADLLSHVTGLPMHEDSYYLTDKPVDVLRRLRHLRPSYELREKYQYINLTYMVATEIITRYSGMPFTEFVSSRIFDALGMTNTTYFPSRATASGYHAHTFTPAGRRIPLPTDTDSLVELTAGPGCITSNARDMTRWMRALLSPDGAGGLSREVLDQPMQPRVVIPFGPPAHYTYGMGWRQTRHFGHYAVQHGGEVPGISTALTLFPEAKLGIVQLSNTDGVHEAFDEIMETIVKIALKVAEPEPATSLPDATPETPENEPAPVASKTQTDVQDLPVETFAGTYHDTGYGSLDIFASTGTGDEAFKVLDAFAKVDNAPSAAPRAGPAQSLYMAWPRSPFYTHVRLERWAEKGHGVFAMFRTSLYPEGYGKDTSPFETGEYELEPWTSIMEFVTDDNGKVVGVGITAALGELETRRQKGGSVKENARVWLEKSA